MREVDGAASPLHLEIKHITQLLGSKLCLYSATRGRNSDNGCWRKIDRVIRSPSRYICLTVNNKSLECSSRPNWMA